MPVLRRGERSETIPGGGRVIRQGGASDGDPDAGAPAPTSALSAGLSAAGRELTASLPPFQWVKLFRLMSALDQLRAGAPASAQRLAQEEARTASLAHAHPLATGVGQLAGFLPAFAVGEELTTPLLSLPGLSRLATGGPLARLGAEAMRTGAQLGVANVLQGRPEEAPRAMAVGSMLGATAPMRLLPRMAVGAGLGAALAPPGERTTNALLMGGLPLAERALGIPGRVAERAKQLAVTHGWISPEIIPGVQASRPPADAPIVETNAGGVEPPHLPPPPAAPLPKETAPEMAPLPIEALPANVPALAGEAPFARPQRGAGDWTSGAPRPFAFDPNSTRNEGRFRLRAPSTIQAETYFRRKSSTPGVSYVMGRPLDGGEPVIQAIRFKRQQISEAQARTWWRHNQSRLAPTWPMEATSPMPTNLQPIPAPTGKLHVTYVGKQETRGTTLEPFHLVNEPSGTTVEFDPTRHQIVGLARRAAPGTVIPPELYPSPTSGEPPPGAVLIAQPFQRAVDAYEAKAGAGSFVQLSPKAQLAVIEVAPEARSVRSLIRQVTGQVKTSAPVAEAAALKRLFQRQAQVARQAAHHERAQLIAHLANMFAQPRRFLRVAQAKFLTPTQVGRIAGLYRESPTGPLTMADLKAATSAAARLRPPPRQPTGTPPRIPRGRALILHPSVQPPLYDLTAFQAAKLSGLEAYRAFRLIDGGTRGTTTTGIYEPTLAVTRQKADEEQLLLERLTRLAPGLRTPTLWARLKHRALGPRALPEDEALLDLAEGRLPPAQITPRLLRAAAEMRETYDALLDRLNVVREGLGKQPIPRRANYMPHLRMQTLLAEVFGGFDQIPDDAVQLTFGEVHPNSPYVWFQNPLTGGPFLKSALQPYQAYVSKALEGIHYPGVIQQVTPLLRELPPRARTYAQDYVDQLLGRRPHPADLLPPPTLMRWIDRERAKTSGGATSGNVLSFFNQILTAHATVSSAGPIPATRAALALAGNTLQRVVNDLAGRVGLQTAAEALLKAHQPDVLQFIEQHSPLIRYRTYDVDFNVKPAVGGRLNPLAAVALAQNAFDVGMVRWAWYAHYLKAARARLSHTEALRTAEDGATATNGNFERAALAPVYRSRLAKSVTQFTVSINNVLNYLRFDVGLQPSRLLRAVPRPPPGTPRPVARLLTGLRSAGERITPHPLPNPSMLRQALYFLGTAAALNALIDAFKIPIKSIGTTDILPGIGAFQGQVPATYALPAAIGRRLLARPAPPPSPGQPTRHPRRAEAPVSQEISQADAALWRAAWLQVRYGNQLRKTLEGIMAIARGGVFTRAGQAQFRITTPAEQTRAVLFGPYGTAAGHAFIQRGFRPAPPTPEEHAASQRRAALTRRLSPSRRRPR